MGVGSDIPAAAAGTVKIGGDLEVRRLGFGTLRPAGRWGEPTDPERPRAILRRALELGVDFFDTADAYGGGVAERLLANALHPYPPGLAIATKGGLVRYGPEIDNERRDGSPRHLRAACEASLRRLGLERINLYQLHMVDPDVPIEESVGALAELRAEGKIRHIGISNVDVEQLDRALAVAPIASVQNRYNLMERGSEEVLERCERDGIVFMPWFPLARGVLATLGDHHLGLEPVTGAATPAQLALAWALGRSPAVLLIPGASRVTQLEENVAAAAVRLRGVAAGGS